MNTTSRKVIIVGAGAAGLMAAGRAAQQGADVLVLEKMEEAGKKILISGKSRCNVTNSAPLTQFIKAYGRKGQFLRNAYARFFRDDLLALLKRYGVDTQEERGGRIFPTSERAKDVRDALVRYATSKGVEIRYGAEASRIIVRNGRIAGVELWSGDHLMADAVIMSTGGASFPATGSTGEGYMMLQRIGHTIVPIRPSLVPLTVAEKQTAKALKGVSLRNVHCTWYTRKGQGKEKVLRLPYPTPDVGEMLFTHFGVSGPLVLTASLGAVDALKRGNQVTLSIDLKPGMSEQDVRQRFQREFETQSHKRLPGLLRGWVPNKLAQVIADLSGVDPDYHVHRIVAEERERLVGFMKDFRWEITGSLPMTSGMVTAGGVSLKEVDPVSFESKIVPGLFVTGELLDLDADTGGFNLQAAFTSGYLAGQHAAQSV